MSEKFTFKINNPVGRWRSFDKKTMDININKKICGVVYDGLTCDIRLMVAKGNSFRWAALKYKPKKLNDAKLWLNDNYKLIRETFDLFLRDN